MSKTKQCFKDQVVLVTGASSGMGRQVAIEFARQGSYVILFSRSQKLLEEVAEKCMEFGKDPLICLGSVENPYDLELTAKLIRERFGRLDIVVANAGTSLRGRFEELNGETFRRQFQTNFFGVVDTVYATLALLKNARGQIVIIGSMSSYIALPGGSPYTCSKFAVRAFAESLRSELSAIGVSLTLVTPGFIDTPMLSAEIQRDWKVMSSSRAAKEITKAIKNRKDEVVLTSFAKFSLFIHRFFPSLIPILARRSFK